MEWTSIYKIKDSIDIYLVDNQYICAYFMNTRIHKKFRVNQTVIRLFEMMDGTLTAEELYIGINEKEKVSRQALSDWIDKMLSAKIITEKLQAHVLPESDRERYERQISYFAEFLDSEKEAEKAQERLQKVRVGIIGCGAVGGDIAIQLASAGVRNFVLMDYDTVNESDCSRHLYYNIKDIGRKKVEVLSDYLKCIDEKICTFISYQAFTPQTDMTDFLNHTDFVIDTADEPYLGYTATMLSTICVPQRIPHYIAGGFDAHLASTGELIIPYVTPCAACYADYFAEVLKDWKPEKHPVAQRENEIGGLASASLFSASYACVEIIKYLAGLMNMEKNYHSRAEFYIDGMKLQYLNPKKNPKCKVCGKHEV